VSLGTDVPVNLLRLSVKKQSSEVRYSVKYIVRYVYCGVLATLFDCYVMCLFADSRNSDFERNSKSEKHASFQEAGGCCSSGISVCCCSCFSIYSG
jgi:hypothetical protein